MRRYAIIAAFLFAIFISETAQAQFLSTTGSCPGVMTFDVTGAIPTSRVMYIRAFGTGSFVLPPWAPCGGTVTGLDSTATFVGWEIANGFGNCTLTATVPPTACGTIYVQVVDTLSCTTSNVILIT